MLVDLAKWVGWVRFGSDQLGCRSKLVTGQNGSFLNGSNGLRVGQKILTCFTMSSEDRSMAEDQLVSDEGSRAALVL